MDSYSPINVNLTETGVYEVVWVEMTPREQRRFFRDEQEAIDFAISKSQHG